MPLVFCRLLSLHRGRCHELSCLQEYQVYWQCKILNIISWSPDRFEIIFTIILLISALLFHVCKDFRPWSGWHRNRRYRPTMFLPALPNKYSQLLLVIGPFSSRPHQVLFVDSAFKYDRFGEDFAVWLYIFLLSAHPVLVTMRHCFGLWTRPQKKELGRRLWFCGTLTSYMSSFSLT